MQKETGHVTVRDELEHRAPRESSNDTTDTATKMLRDLAAALAQAGGFRSRLHTEAGHAPALIVTSAAASQLSERICASPLAGRWNYWWSWAETISDRTDEAAAKISRVLRAR